MSDTQKLTPDLVREFVISAHFNLDKVKAMLGEYPALLTVKHQWGENDFEDGLGAASHVGNRPIAEFLLERGAPLTICTAAMLGRKTDVETFIKADGAQANAHGAHGIPLMFHAAMSGSTELTSMLKNAGCTEGYSFAVHAAIAHGHLDMLRWLLDNGATDLQIANYEGKSPLKKALEGNQTAIADLLRERGAEE
ncbi:MAG: ankyrin repeat domain-containing protein [Anaerolineae bacterium]